jgi:hypothetical protein
MAAAYKKKVLCDGLEVHGRTLRKELSCDSIIVDLVLAIARCVACAMFLMPAVAGGGVWLLGVQSSSLTVSNC